MTSDSRIEAEVILPSQVRDGDLVIHRAALEQHPDLDAEEMIAKLGELGLPPSVVARVKIGEDAVELAAYDPETQPPLGKHSWDDFEAFLEASNMGSSLQGRLRSELSRIHNHGIGRDGGGVNTTQTRAPMLYSKSSGEPFPYTSSLDVTRREDMSDALIDMGTLYDYLRFDQLSSFGGIGPVITAAYTEFVNTKIAELS